VTRRARLWIGALAVVALLAGAWSLAMPRDDLPWIVWKLEGPGERGASPLPIQRVAARPDGEALDGDWRVWVRSHASGGNGQGERIWEALERPRTLAFVWRWWGRRTGRHWLDTDCSFGECDETVSTAAGRWRCFVREPLPGDTWPRRPDPALVGRWRGSFVEDYPNRSSTLEFHEDGTVSGLAHPPGVWGVRDDVVIVTWDEGSLLFGSWRGRRAGKDRFEGADSPGTLWKE
jgi:hypothetical protein